VVGGKYWFDLAQDRDRWHGTSKRRNEPSVSIKCGGFVDYLRTGEPIKNESAVRSKEYRAYLNC